MKMAKKKYIETPEILLSYWEEYKTQVKANPRYKYELNKFGEPTAIPLECPLTQEGFDVFCYDNYKCSVHHYFENTNNAYDEYWEVCSRIVKERRNDQITGGAVGQYNASITQRLNNLAENTKTEVSGGLNIPNMPDIGNRK